MKPRHASFSGRSRNSVSLRPLRSFFAGGFECSTHKLSDGQRLDLIQSTRHDVFAHADYRRLVNQGIRVARDGLRWHLIETTPGKYDFSSARTAAEAAAQSSVQVIWDLLHFGWPDHYDIFEPDFPKHFADFVGAAGKWLRGHSPGPYWFTPVNEISWVAWAGGTAGCINPFARDKAVELKRQLVSCTLCAIRALEGLLPDVHFTAVDPLMHVIPTPGRPEEVPIAHARNEAQFEAWEMLYGRACPELGGQSGLFDLMGVNFYPHNEWILSEEGRGFVRTEHPAYKPLRELLQDVFARYQTPIYISETGTEDEERVGWLHYVCSEVAAAIEAGVPIEGICLYPILNHPGWIDDRHCYNGLWDYADDQGDRAIYEPLEAEIHRWQQVFDARDRDRLAVHVVEDVEMFPPPHELSGHVDKLTGPLGSCGGEKSEGNLHGTVRNRRPAD